VNLLRQYCRGRRREFDWFKDNYQELNPLFEERNRLYKKWLSSGKNCDLINFRKARKMTKQLVSSLLMGDYYCGVRKFGYHSFDLCGRKPIFWA